VTTNAQALPLLKNERLHAQGAALADLDAWDDQIAALNVALTDAAVARDRLADIGRQMDLEEARAVAGTIGGNAESRKASVTLFLNEHDPDYQALLSQQREARLKLADAERRAEIARQQCRLLRAAVRLGAVLEQ
jgi:hypothetical protein